MEEKNKGFALEECSECLTFIQKKTNREGNALGKIRKILVQSIFIVSEKVDVLTNRKAG